MKEFTECSLLLLILILSNVCAIEDTKLATAAEERISAGETLRDRYYQAEAREEDIQLINDEPIYDPYIKLKDENDEPSVEWLTSYGGEPYGFEVVFFALLPLVLAKIIRITKNIFRPNLHLRQGMSDFPLVPLIYLQQTKLEQSVKRERRNGIDWLGKKFLIRASDNFVDTKRAAGTTPAAKRMVSKNPWALLRFMAKFHHKAKGYHHDPEASLSVIKLKRRVSIQAREERRASKEEAKKTREHRREQKRRAHEEAEKKRHENEDDIKATGEPAPEAEEEKVDKFPKGPSFKEELKEFRKKREHGSRKLHKATPLDAEGRQPRVYFEDDRKSKKSSKESLGAQPSLMSQHSGRHKKKHHKGEHRRKSPAKNASLQLLRTTKPDGKADRKNRHSLTHVNAPPEKKPEAEEPYHIRQMKEFMPEKEKKKRKSRSRDPENPPPDSSGN